MAHKSTSRAQLALLRAVPSATTGPVRRSAKHRSLHCTLVVSAVPSASHERAPGCPLSARYVARFYPDLECDLPMKTRSILLLMGGVVRIVILTCRVVTVKFGRSVTVLGCADSPDHARHLPGPAGATDVVQRAGGPPPLYRANVNQNDVTERRPRRLPTDDFSCVPGVRRAFRRDFTAKDGRDGAAPKTILGDALWRHLDGARLAPPVGRVVLNASLGRFAALRRAIL